MIETAPITSPMVVGFPFSRSVSPEWAMAMLLQSWPLQLSRRYVVTSGMPVADARNHIASRAIELDATYLLFVDDDTIPPSNAIRMLKYKLDQNPDVAAIGAIVCTKTDPPEPVVFKHHGEGTCWNWRLGDVFECDRVSVSCMMIRVDAIRDIPKPLFVMSDNQTEGMYFCELLKKHNLKIMAHGGVLCTHIDMNTGVGYSLPTDSYPYLNKTEDLVLQP